MTRLPPGQAGALLAGLEALINQAPVQAPRREKT